MDCLTGAANVHTDDYKQCILMTVLAITCSTKWLFLQVDKYSILGLLDP
jgi:hypothetical protein